MVCAKGVARNHSITITALYPWDGSFRAVAQNWQSSMLWRRLVSDRTSILPRNWQLRAQTQWRGISIWTSLRRTAACVSPEALPEAPVALLRPAKGGQDLFKHRWLIRPIKIKKTYFFGDPQDNNSCSEWWPLLTKWGYSYRSEY